MLDNEDNIKEDRKKPKAKFGGIPEDELPFIWNKTTTIIG